MDVKLYVGNLSYTTTEVELRNLFAQAGTIASVDMIKDRYTGDSKGFAFIEMSTQAEAEKAIQMYNGYSLGNRELRVSMARPREERPQGGFGNRRSGGFGNRSSGGGGGGGRDRRGGKGGGGSYRY